MSSMEQMVSSKKINDNLDFGKILAFFNVDMNKDNNNHICKVHIGSNNISVLVLSCYDPLCWQLSGNTKSLKKIIFAKSHHSRKISDCWFPNDKLAKIVIIGNDSDVGSEFGVVCNTDEKEKEEMGDNDKIELIDEYFDYYDYLSSNKKINDEIDTMKSKYQCQIVSIVRKHEAPTEIVI